MPSAEALKSDFSLAENNAPAASAAAAAFSSSPPVSRRTPVSGGRQPSKHVRNVRIPPQAARDEM